MLGLTLGFTFRLGLVGTCKSRLAPIPHFTHSHSSWSLSRRGPSRRRTTMSAIHCRQCVRSAIFFISEFSGDDLASYRNSSISCISHYGTSLPSFVVIDEFCVIRAIKVRPLSIRHFMMMKTVEGHRLYTGKQQEYCYLRHIYVTTSA